MGFQFHAQLSSKYAFTGGIGVVGDASGATGGFLTGGFGAGNAGGPGYSIGLGAGGFNGNISDYGGPFVGYSGGGVDVFTGVSGSRRIYGGGLNVGLAGGSTVSAGPTVTSQPTRLSDSALIALPALMLPAIASSLAASVLCH